MLPRFAEALGVDLRWLLFGVEWQDPLDAILEALQALPARKDFDDAKRERREIKKALDANYRAMTSMESAFEAAIAAMGGRRPTLHEVAKSAAEARDRVKPRSEPTVRRRAARRGSQDESAE